MPLFPVENLSLPIKSLRERYLVPPFSILHTQVGGWLAKRNEWEAWIKNRANNIRNELAKTNTPYTNKFDYDEGYRGLERNGATSTFDPFLCEILVRWFSRSGDTILDPFAGGHIRGVVSSFLGRNYVGFDVNDKQVLANRENWRLINEEYRLTDLGNVEWVLGDSTTMEFPRGCNMMLTCPPYYNLEVYSDNPNDLSTLDSYEEFLIKYASIIKKCYNALEDNSFAVIVVGEIRDSNGIMYGFVPDTINAFKQAGFKYYNEIILENRIDSLGVRCPKYFEQSRKIGRHHQNVLVFYKGDPNPNKIHEKFGNFEK